MRPNCTCYVATTPYADRGFYPHDSKCASLVRACQLAPTNLHSGNPKH